MLALAEEHGITSPLSVTSTSGSGPIGAYYVAGQYDSIRKITLDLLPSPELVSMGSKVDIDYLVDDIFKNIEPLDSEAIADSQTDFIIPVLNCETGEVHYLSDWKNADVFEALRATLAIPVGYRLNPKVFVNGEAYLDSPLTSSAQTHIKNTVERGDGKILVIDTSSNGFSGFLSNRIFGSWLFVFRGFNIKFRRNYRKTRRDVNEYIVPEGVDIFTLNPRALEINVLQNDEYSMRRAFEQGYRETKENEELASFLDR